jgi:hypothetical protein
MSISIDPQYTGGPPNYTWPVYPNYSPPPSFPYYAQVGCICPPTSENTCRGDFCPRQKAKPLVAT